MRETNKKKSQIRIEKKYLSFDRMLEQSTLFSRSIRTHENRELQKQDKQRAIKKGKKSGQEKIIN